MAVEAHQGIEPHAVRTKYKHCHPADAYVDTVSLDKNRAFLYCPEFFQDRAKEGADVCFNTSMDDTNLESTFSGVSLNVKI